MNKSREKNNGITLIALVVTIIVLIILAGISINLVLGENGIITKAQEAKNLQTKAQEKEKIELAIGTAQIEKNGYQELSQNNLQNAIDERFGTGNAIIIDNEDGTFTVSFIDRKRDYIITSNGVENGIDWNTVFDNAVAPKSQNEERNNGVIGIGTDGKTVDMDLWQYCYDNSTQGYVLNSSEVINNLDYGGTNTTSVIQCGYLGNIIDGKIEGTVPAYIKESDGEWYPVTSLYRTFQGNSTNNEKLKNLKVAPKLPATVTNMLKTFVSATNLENMPIIPSNVTNMESTFYECDNLIKVTNIPNKVTTLNCTFYGCNKLEYSPEINSAVVTNMKGTFQGCSSLVSAPKIPNSVINMGATFSSCTTLTKAPIIPNNVTILVATFKGCSNLQGIIEINANVTGIQLGEEYYNNIDYYNCLSDSCTEEGLKLKVTGTCTILQEIINNANNPNITL